MSKEKIGRIGGSDWMAKRADHAIAVYNANYTESGQPSSPEWAYPWSVTTPNRLKTFTTHAEALAWAFEKAEAGK